MENSIVFMDKDISKEEKDNLHKLFNLNSKIVFNIGEVLNNKRMRFENEPVRHKVLDLIGDLALFGKPIIGHIIATRSGHSSNIEFVKQLRQANNL